ncbi:hypothetical protein ACP275_05G011500 [Erythranthe tilingii]
MALIKKQSFLFFLVITLSLFSTPSSEPGRHNQHHPHYSHAPPPDQSAIFKTKFSSELLLSTISLPTTPRYSAATPGVGEWSLLQESVGVSAMHMQLLHNNKIVIFDRADFGSSNLSLPAGKCRFDPRAAKHDCTAHSLLYDVDSNTYRPLMVQTDVWCSSGAVNSLGTLVQTGGYHDGYKKIRTFTPCNDDSCDWVELPLNLTVQRWYGSDHILPDDRVIVVGGRRAYSYEFFPNNDNRVFPFPLLKETTDPKEENNLYPFLHLLPDGNLFVFANRRSLLLDYKNDRIVREYPEIPGEKRNYPATGSSVMLPLKLGNSSYPAVEVLICGGARGGAYLKALRGRFMAASKSCGRIRVTDPEPVWVMEDMPLRRVMPDMLLLPTGDVIIVNGAARGSAGWECGDEPVLSPVMYYPDEPDPAKRFSALSPSAKPRMYHSAAILLPDGRVLVGGSNPHVKYNFTAAKYPTDLSLEAFSPPYLGTEYAHLRPSILSIDGTEDNAVAYGQQFTISFSLGGFQLVPGEYLVTMVAPSFTTHSFAMNQRLLVLYVSAEQQIAPFAYKVTVHAPPTANIAPPGYYMLFVVHQGVPCHSVWIKLHI